MTVLILNAIMYSNRHWFKARFLLQQLLLFLLLEMYESRSNYSRLQYYVRNSLHEKAEKHKQSKQANCYTVSLKVFVIG